MLRGPLGINKYKPKFSGHDTFPFRYAWLTKLVRYLEDGNIKKIKERKENTPEKKKRGERVKKVSERRAQW